MVAGGAHAEELAADLPGFGDDDGCEAAADGEVVEGGEGRVGGDHLGAGDVAQAVRLHRLQVRELVLEGHVVVEETGATDGCHGDGHVRLGDWTGRRGRGGEARE